MSIFGKQEQRKNIKQILWLRRTRANLAFEGLAQKKSEEGSLGGKTWIHSERGVRKMGYPESAPGGRGHRQCRQKSAGGRTKEQKKQPSNERENKKMGEGAQRKMREKGKGEGGGRPTGDTRNSRLGGTKKKPKTYRGWAP